MLRLRRERKEGEQGMDIINEYCVRKWRYYIETHYVLMKITSKRREVEAIKIMVTSRRQNVPI